MPLTDQWPIRDGGGGSEFTTNVMWRGKPLFKAHSFWRAESMFGGGWLRRTEPNPRVTISLVFLHLGIVLLLFASPVIGNKLLLLQASCSNRNPYTNVGSKPIRDRKTHGVATEVDLLQHFVAGESLRQLSRACFVDAIATEVDLLQDVILGESPCQLGCASLVTVHVFAIWTWV